MKNLFLVALIVFIAGSGYFYLKQAPTSTTTPTQTAQNDATAGSATEFDQMFNINGLDYTYDVKEIRVKKGEKVKIVFNNTEGFHDLKIDEFNAATKQIKAGETESIIFTADKAGTFEYYCSVVQHHKNGMFGKLIVE